MAQNVKVQEGENPAEPIEELLPEYERMMDDLESLVKRINKTNSVNTLGSRTLTDAIAERDNIKARIITYRELYSAAAIKQERYSRSEVKYVRCVDTVALQKKIDELSKQYRLLDTSIQATNWIIELAE